MVIDLLSNAHLYRHINERIAAAFHYLQTTDLASIPEGKYAIDGDNLFAIVQEYQTVDVANEQMEAHRKYIDVQYVIQGEELVGHAFLGNQQLSKEYSEEEDFLLVPDVPDFFTHFRTGIFMIFFPTDLHIPCIKVNEVAKVKKVVVKVKI